MNPSKNGLSTAGKVGIVVMVAIVVVGTAYLLPGLSKGGASQSTSSQAGAVSTVEGSQINGTYSIVKFFSKMLLAVDVYDATDGMVSNATYSYSVLGKGTINSTQYTRVEFLTVGVGDDVVMWFNSSGGLGRVDVLGQRNYTGNGLPNMPFVTTYTNLFGFIPTITTNATLLSLLSKSSETTTSIGPTNADVTTYELAAPTPSYSSMTLKLATIPSKNVELAVYFYLKTHDKSTTLIEVTSLTA
jgi:hypothetical protein